MTFEHLSGIEILRASDGTYTAICDVGGRRHQLDSFMTLDALLACCGELVAQDLRQRKTIERMPVVRAEEA